MTFVIFVRRMLSTVGPVGCEGSTDWFVLIESLGPDVL